LLEFGWESGIQDGCGSSENAEIGISLLVMRVGDLSGFDDPAGCLVVRVFKVR
jgi:hypothetical protein